MSFLPISPSPPALYYGLLAFCLLLGLTLLVLAWRRPRPRQRGLRLLAGATAAIALWFTAFPPLHALPAARAEAILLTEGYSPDTLRHLLRQFGAGTPVWAFGNLEVPATARPLPSLLTLTEQKPALRSLHVLGVGLPAVDLPALAPLALRHHSGNPGTGFRTAWWSSQLPLGAVLQVEGAVSRSRRAGPAWVVLRAAGAARDSVRLPAGGSGAFLLHYQPKVAGLATYQLLLRQAGQPPLAEPVPVEVIPAPLPSVLLLAAAPSFEFRFLKNFLAEAHYPVALRTSVSRGLVQTDVVNQPRQNLTALSPGLLARYGVVVADAASLAALSAAEIQALQAAVVDGRVGLVTLADAAPLPRAVPGRADFAVRARPAPAVPQPLRWPARPAAAAAPLPAQLLPAPSLRPLIIGPGGVVAAARRRVGLGAVVVSVVPETFRWALGGQPAVYASFWNQLLGGAVPPAPAGASWYAGSRWPRPGQPLTLHLAGALPGSIPTVRALAGGPAAALALRQDTRLPEWSTAQYWPAAAGWYQLHGPGTLEYRFFVYPDSAWRAPERLARTTALRRYGARPATVAAGSEVAFEPWPAGWFFGLFLLCAGYLWLEEKL